MRVLNWMKRVERASLLWELTFVMGGVAIVGHWLGWPVPVFRAALMIGALTFLMDAVLASIRIREEMAEEARQAEELTAGVYRIAKDHKIIQDGRRVIVYGAGEEL